MTLADAVRLMLRSWRADDNWAFQLPWPDWASVHDELEDRLKSEGRTMLVADIPMVNFLLCGVPVIIKSTTLPVARASMDEVEA